MIFPVGTEEIMFSNEQIKVSIVVNIHPQCTPTETVDVKAMRFGEFFKCLILFLNEQFGAKPITTELRVGVKKILTSVLVHVTQRGRHTIHDQIHIQGIGDIQKGPIALILKERIGTGFVVNDEEVLPSILIQVPPQALKAQSQVNINASRRTDIGKSQIAVIAHERIPISWALSHWIFEIATQM